MKRYEVHLSILFVVEVGAEDITTATELGIQKCVLAGISSEFIEHVETQEL